MGLLNLFVKKNKEDKTAMNVASSISINDSVENSTAQATVKYSRPDYNPNTRQEY